MSSYKNTKPEQYNATRKKALQRQSAPIGSECRCNLVTGLSLLYCVFFMKVFWEIVLKGKKCLLLATPYRRNKWQFVHKIPNAFCLV